MTFLEQTSSAIINPLVSIFNGLLQALPGLIGAIIILIVGYLVAELIGHIVRKIVEQTRLVSLLSKKTNAKKFLGGFDLTYFLGAVAKWYVFILFLNPAAEITNLKTLSVFFINLAIWVPSLIAAVAFGVIGFMFAQYVEAAVLKTKATGAAIIAEVLKVVILIFAAILALAQLGINVMLAQSSFLIVLSGVVFAIALALGIGFGLGLKDEAKSMVKNLRRRL